MRTLTIEVDEIIMDYLKKHAEPFSDTPNSVLHRLLFGTSKEFERTSISIPSRGVNVPRALLQILDVIYEVVQNGRTRTEATRIVAVKNGRATQTIIDKYCRQLGKKAHEIDRLLDEPGLTGFKMTLNTKFSRHKEMINDFFDNLSERTKPQSYTPHKNHQPKTQPAVIRRSSSPSVRKQRDIPLERALKTALGGQLRTRFGTFVPKGQSQLIFNGARLLCKYSSFHKDQSRWFWGVSKTFWENWEETDYLALIFENENRAGYSYLLLNSDEALRLFGLCSESMGEKKINMRIYMDEGVVKFQEWKDFDVKGNTKALDIDAAK